MTYMACFSSTYPLYKPAFQSQSLKIVSAVHVGYTLCRVPVDRVVCKSMMFSDVQQCENIHVVLSLSAGCRRNSSAEKAEITGWIFGR